MKKAALLFLFLFSFSFAFGQTKLDQPWNDSSRALIIDPYAENPIDFEKLLTDKRICGIIHKATQGNIADRLYSEREAAARKNGLLWGSYHMGMKGDPVAQADFYLGTAQIDSSELMALDLESPDTNKFMSLPDAERFIRRIYEKTGRYPLLYCNNNVLEEIGKKYSDTSVFARCGLWYARFLKQMPDFNKKVWKEYSLWQFSCEVNCKKTGECWYNVPGVLYDMDVNVYNGSIAELRYRWPEILVQPNPVIEAYYWLNGFDLDGDQINDRISFEYSGGAHCCYKIHITLSSDRKECVFPFEMDGGYPAGVDNSQPDQFNISNTDSDSLPEISMKIQSYNGELSEIPKKWKKEYGIQSNYITIEYQDSRLVVRDQKR